MIVCLSAVSVVTSPFSFLILLIWVFSLFFLMSLANGLSILFIFSNSQLFVLLIFAIVFFVSIPFISALIFMISFLLLSLGFFCSFSNCFRFKVSLFISNVSCFLRYDCIAINFPFWTAFAASHRFWLVVFSLSFVSTYFLLHLWFIQWSLGYLVVYCLASMCLYFFPYNWFLIS